MAATTMVHVRVDEHIKTQASETLAGMGLTVSDAIRVFLTRIVADQATSFRAQGAKRRYSRRDERGACHEQGTLRIGQ